MLYFALGSLCRLFIIPISLSDIGRILGLLPFSGVIFIVLRCTSRSSAVSCVNSPILIPVSLSVCRIVAVSFPHDAIRMSISCSVGMNGSFCTVTYRGGFHVICL